MDEICQFLRSVRISTNEKLIGKMRDIGVTCLVDLTDLQIDDLSDTELTLIEKRRLIRSIKEADFSSSASPVPGPNSSVNIEGPTSQPSSTPSTKQKPSSGYQIPHQQQSIAKGSKIYYFFCKELFKRNIRQEVISNLDLEKDSLELIVKMISERHKYPLDTYALEFYSHEGYPLCVNEHNEKFTLSHWRLVNESVLYVFVRPKEQPAWACNDHDFNADSDSTSTDPKIGPNHVQIYSQLYGTFKINIDLKGNNVVSNLKSKISSYTGGLPLKCIKLYKEANSYNTIKNENPDIKHGDCLVFRIEGFVPSLIDINICKKLYNPINPQTDRGFAKFYAIVTFLISSRRENYQKFTTSILKFTGFPPLAYALDQLFQYKSILSLSHMVVLFEGFFQLSQAILEYFCNDVEPDKCFEFSDYIFGLLLKFAGTVTDSTQTQTEKIIVMCPTTQRQLLNPVTAPQSTVVYERISAEQIIRRGHGLVDCSCDSLKLEDIRPAIKHERLLMFRAFSDSGTCYSFDVWTKIPLVQRDIPPVMISCTWKELDEAIKLLQIQSPDALSSRKYCLTYIDKGQFVFYTEPLKSVDKQWSVYDPISALHKSYTKSEMETFAKDWKSKACHQLTNYLNPKIKSSLPPSELKSTCAIGEKQGVTEIVGTPDEAIMVLVDCSGSMSHKVFNDSSDTYSKLTAAKELFYAFANRTDAYGFNHVIGLITFSSTVSVKVEFTQIMDYFKDFVSGITPGGHTALNNALSVAAEKLKKLVDKYPKCHKRILCLTDGEDNGSKIKGWEISKRLQKEKVVVDTVLITGTKNVSQKAISNATGGFCFLPSNIREATRLFEMEVLLRIQDRSVPYPRRDIVCDQNAFEVYENLVTYPYDSTNPYEFKTNFSAEIGQFVSSSAKKMVNLASFMGQSSAVATTSNTECVRRVVLEARHYLRDPHSSVDVFPGKNNVLKWKILLKGPEECPYAGGVFLLLAKFPNEYPSKPPEIRFVTPIYHCNINSSGRICHPILGRNYVPSMTVRSIIDNIYGLLMAPEPLDPLDSVLASQYHESRAVYESQAAEHTEKYAKKIGWDELKKELTEDEDLDVAEGLVCPLTNKLFVDPVLTSHGFMYERSALLEHLKKNGNRDPLAHKPVKVEELKPLPAIQQLAEELRKSNLYK